MVCFVWLIVVAKGEAARFSLGVTKKELCDYGCNREDIGGEGVCGRGWGLGGAQTALQGCQSVINIACISFPFLVCFAIF